MSPPPPPPHHEDAEAHLEIERKFLLSALPDLPADAAPVRIEQGYLPETEPGAAGDVEGRIRRAISADGTTVCTHTIKHGSGIERVERERLIAIDEFELLWPRTEHRRVLKTRYKAPGQLGAVAVVWEIDRFVDRDLVLAEVELPSADIDVIPPDWLAPHIVRDVTDEPMFRNYSLATSNRAS